MLRYTGSFSIVLEVAEGTFSFTAAGDDAEEGSEGPKKVIDLGLDGPMNDGDGVTGGDGVDGPW